MNELNKWHDSEIKDDFEDPTGEKMQLFNTEGTYSNEDVFDDKLNITIRNEDNIVLIFIYDEKWNSLINVNQIEYGIINIKKADGTKLTSDFFYNPEGFIEVEGDSKFFRLINNGKLEQVKVVIPNPFSNYRNEKYSFSFTTSDKLYTPPKIHSQKSGGGCASVIVLLITVTSILSLIL